MSIDLPKPILKMDRFLSVPEGIRELVIKMQSEESEKAVQALLRMSATDMRRKLKDLSSD